jgi:hypothetical protein
MRVISMQKRNREDKLIGLFFLWFKWYVDSTWMKSAILKKMESQILFISTKRSRKKIHQLLNSCIE